MFEDLLPDAFYLALPLLTSASKVSWTQFKDSPGLVQPKESSLLEYLNHCASCWHELPMRTRGEISMIFTNRTSARLTFMNMMKSVSVPVKTFQASTTTHLVIGRLLQQCPIERLKVLEGHRTSRFPSLAHIKYLLYREKISKEATEIDVSKLFYLIDNQGNLETTNKTLAPFFTGPNDWKGFTKSNPKASEMLTGLNNRSLYVFCGHGTGSDAVGGWGRTQRKGISAHCHLIGCSSGRLRDGGRTEPRGSPLK